MKQGNAGKTKTTYDTFNENKDGHALAGMANSVPIAAYLPKQNGGGLNKSPAASVGLLLLTVLIAIIGIIRIQTK